MKIFKSSAALIILQTVSLVASFSISVIVTRATGPAGKGAYSLLLLINSMALMLTGLGINTAIVYHVGKKQHPLADVVAAILPGGIILGLIGALGAGLAYLFFRQTYFHAIQPQQIAILLVSILLMQIMSLMSAVVLGLNKPIEFAGINLLQLLVTVIAQLALAFTGNLTPTSALLAWCCAIFLSALLSLALVSRSAPLGWRVDKTILRELLSYGYKAYIANLTSFFNYRLDSLIINGLLSVASLGYYSVAVSLGEVIWLAANSVSTVMFPHISSVERKEADRLTPIVCRNTLFITLLGVIAMLVLGRWVILLAFSSSMLPALNALYLLLPGILSLSGGKVIASYLVGIGKPIYATYISSANLVLTVVLDFILIPRYGIAGAAAASSIVYTLATGVGLYFFLKESGSGLFETIFIRRSDLVQYRNFLVLINRRLEANRNRA